MADEGRRPVAVVTGGNRGLGLETARQLARRGARVMLAARDAGAAESAAQGLAREGLAVEHGVLDVTDAGSVARFADALGKDGAGVCALVNNAGVALDGFDAGVARATIDTNFHGPLRVTDALAPLLRPGACVVMVSSGLGDLSAYPPSIRARFAAPALTRDELVALVESFVRAVSAGTHSREGWPSSAYGVSKAGLNALTRVLARALPAQRVNAVCPGWVRTRMGGRGAPRSVEDGASGIVWAATLPPDGPTGGIFRDGKPVDW